MANTNYIFTVLKRPTAARTSDPGPRVIYAVHCNDRDWDDALWNIETFFEDHDIAVTADVVEKMADELSKNHIAKYDANPYHLTFQITTILD